MAAVGNAYSQEVTRSYHSFSGVDIQATFGSTPIGAIQGVSYTITREKAPVYTMGSPDPRSFSRGKRGIAGSLIFVVLNRSNLIEAMDAEKRQFYAKRGDLSWSASAQSVDATQQSPSATPGDIEGANVKTYGISKKVFAWYHDQLPPFSIVLTALTEYGATIRMAMLGVEILNAGSGISVDDITTDENMTFVCRTVIPWRFRGFAGNEAVNTSIAASI